MTEPDPDNEPAGIEYLRGKAEEAFQTRLGTEIGAQVAALLPDYVSAGYTVDDMIRGDVTTNHLNDGFLPADAIPTTRVVFDTTRRRMPVFKAMRDIPVATFGPGAGRVFRDDNRNPWKIMVDGFQHRSIAQDMTTVAGSLRNVAATMGVVTWAHIYHQSANGNGVPTVSTAFQDEGVGVSKDWQYAITLPTLSHQFRLAHMTTTVLGGPNLAGGLDDETTLLMDAATLDATSIVAISGGPMNEFTFLTPVKPEWIVGFRRKNAINEYAWRAPFEHEWRSVANAAAIRAILEQVDEFGFPE